MAAKAMKRRGKGRPKETVSSIGAEFFKVFLPHLSSHHLQIPPDFVKNSRRILKERVTLKDTEGKKWHVYVEKTANGSVFLKNGWPSFVSDHCLSAGDFLVFQYDRNYSFIVKIFGTNGCRKEATSTPVKIEQEDIEFK
ncbi:B3 domain-containing protein [Sesamum alatum]|uniref:B3 domain-containing protein n=1 Tax=Sesamum alatum TaxID=300844 RepID=A0AAE1XM04_9LAMI|nr:B3 domain-containing protein [Sesamum alatum]